MLTEVLPYYFLFHYVILLIEWPIQKPKEMP
ncbi:hypothetical protein Pan241w_47360 [Gimesia alba]|uniref:Uncharacterized protein n=1 Tax=Gimesia alba TaxID=2527973 RepID=A0A517RL55_9PLAN|nr:hypothetical protein Pan241w_47360 [Gimesia alba]